MRRAIWQWLVFWSRWRNRLRYVAAAPLVYRNWWVLPVAKLGVGVVLELRNGLRYHIRPHTTDLGVINEACLLDPYFGAGHIALPDDAIVIDVGANIGDFTLQAVRRCPSGHVIAIEPLGEHVRIIDAHVAMNGIRNVTCIQAALGGEDGESMVADNGSCSRSGTGTELVRLKTLSLLMDEQGTRVNRPAQDGLRRRGVGHPARGRVGPSSHPSNLHGVPLRARMDVRASGSVATRARLSSLAHRGRVERDSVGRAAGNLSTSRRSPA
jgi:hypothetical protein